MFSFVDKTKMVEASQALPGRDEVMLLNKKHAVLGSDFIEPLPAEQEQIQLGMGCFWGAERAMWQLPGVIYTAVGYAAGYTPNPSYQEVCSGLTGHNEVVLVQFDREKTSLEHILAAFWQTHNPTQGMRQGNDVGTQYRSGIYYYDEEQKCIAEKSLKHYQKAIGADKLITTEIIEAGPFYFAEEYHQQYLHKNPNGYCGLGGLGIAFAAD